jgi:hypothetical protein
LPAAESWVGHVPRTIDGLREFYAFRDFPHFIDVYKAVSALVTRLS